MYYIESVTVALRSFFETGGPVLYLILLATTIMWTFIIERLWFFRSVMPSLRQSVVDEWEGRRDQTSWGAHRIRDMLISEVSVQARQYLPIIKTIMALLPLLGLFGTVYGMIKVFEVMAFHGTGNARLMAGGVSQATIPTMAGLVAALSGLYVSVLLERKATREVGTLEDSLVHH
ncbi:MAG: MotA/TolQ/ExbB proton channel family protein [Pseudomonadota bacterium]